jgi:tetratricopeptide (TPR) repeat protein
MKSSSLRFTAAAAALLLAPIFSISTRVAAQQTPSTPPANSSAPAQQQTQPGQTQTPSTGDLPNALPSATVDPAEEADYKAFMALKPEDTDKRIEAGNAFVAKYPTGHYTGSVYSALTQAEYQKQDIAKVEVDGEKAIAANPDDLSTLIIVSTLIPRDKNTAGDAKELDKAEAYAKHAIALIPTLQKPATLTDDQFTTMKANAQVQAHSALGLVYFRKQNVDGCVTELKASTSDAKNADATDFYVLGVCQSAQNNYADAADSFGKCAAMQSALSAGCKQKADEAKAKGGNAKPSLSK